MEHVELFCEKLVVLVKGKSVLSGYLKDIKEEYKKKNVIVCGDIDTKKIESLDGVIEVLKEKEEHVIKIKDSSYVPKLFKEISKFNNITKFVVEDASLNEIFIEKVGEAYEK